MGTGVEGLHKGSCMGYLVAIVENDAAAAARLVRLIEASPYAERLRIMEQPVPLFHLASEKRIHPNEEDDLDAADREGASNGVSAPVSTALPDILFVDVRLDHGANGIELIQRAIPPTARIQVIYVSAYLEYAPAAYHTRHTWFLSKPVDQSELNAALERAINELDAGRAEPLLVHHGSTLVRIDPHQIRYAESDRRKVRIHERDRVVEVYARISDVEEQLPDQFVRCHKSFLVNLAFVSELCGRELILTDGERLPVSQRCRKHLSECLAAFIGRLL